MENKIISINYSYAKKIFESLSYDNYKKLIFTNESLYSSSKARGSKILINIIKNIFQNDDLVITDGTSNIGTDSIHLANEFKYVNCVEIDKNNFEALKNNTNILNLKKNIRVINGDINEEIKDLKQDIIYIDAPWGGKGYKELTKLKLYLGKVEILDFYLKNKDMANVFIFKIPFNYDFDYLRSYICTKVIIYPYIVNNVIKYFLLAIGNIKSL